MHLYDIKAIVFDTTSSNTGDKKGLAGLLKNARENEWRQQRKEGEPSKLIVKGCEDHLMNLMSKDYEKYLVENSSPMFVEHGKHRATDVVQMIIATIGHKRRGFRSFLRTKGVKRIQIPRISSTRFSWRDLATLFVWKYLFYIILFLATYVTLTKHEILRLQWLLYPEVQGVMASRACFAKHFLLPGMKLANSIYEGWFLTSFLILCFNDSPFFFCYCMHCFS